MAVFDTSLYLVLALALITSASPTLGLLTVVLLLASLARVVRGSLRLHRQWKRVHSFYASLVGIMEESITALRLVRAFSFERIQRRRLLAQQKEYLRELFSGVWLWATRLPTAHVLFALAFPGVLWMGGRLTLQGTLPVGDLAKILIYLVSIAHRVCGLTHLSNLWEAAHASASRIEELLCGVQPLASGKRVPGRRPAALVFDRVGLTRNHAHILRDISLTLTPGTFVVITGPTGSGKTALLTLLPRFHDPTTGRILWGDVDLREFSLSCLRRSVTYVFPEPFLFHGTIQENLTFGLPHASRKRIEEAARIACADEFIENLPNGYQTVIGERGIRLSGGQKQRLALARALLLQPMVLILDGATTNLDPETEARIWKRLVSLDPMPMILWVTHRPFLLQKADWIIVLENGTIAQEGTHQKLLAQPGPYREITSPTLLPAGLLVA